LELEIAAGLVTVFTLAITMLSARSYTRSGSRKVLIVTCAFGLLFLKGVILSYGLLQEEVAWESLLLMALVLDAVVAIVLFVAIVVRKD
jgi:heme/copper-type cytochrome/quinol oxidase subunit 3